MPIPTPGSSVGSGGTSLAGSNIWIAGSSQIGGTYSTSGITYIPLIAGNSDWIQFQLVSALATDATIIIKYAMSASSAGDIDLTQQELVVSSDPDGALSAGSSVSITPGAGTTIKTTTITVSSLTADGIITVKLTRSNIDSHTGDMRIIGIKMGI